jgi:hypothetical protein
MRAVPGWPGEDVFPPQPMVTQIRRCWTATARRAATSGSRFSRARANLPPIDAAARWSAVSCNIAIDASAPAIRLNSSSASTAEPDRPRSRPLCRRSVRVGEPGRPSATCPLGTSWGTTRRVGSVPLATFAEAPCDTTDTRSTDLTECVRSVHQDDARIARPGRFPYGARRERAPTPNTGFCSLGTMRKLAAPKTSLRSAAVMATLRTADLSCADWRRASTSRWDTKRAPPEYRVVFLARRREDSPAMVKTRFGVGAPMRRRARTKVPLSAGASGTTRAARAVCR